MTISPSMILPGASCAARSVHMPPMVAGHLVPSPRRQLEERRSITCRNGKRLCTLSAMESNFEGRPSAEDAAADLRELASDRQALADSVHVPRTLLAALGGVAAWWV